MSGTFDENKGLSDHEAEEYHVKMTEAYARNDDAEARKLGAELEAKLKASQESSGGATPPVPEETPEVEEVPETTSEGGSEEAEAGEKGGETKDEAQGVTDDPTSAPEQETTAEGVLSEELLKTLDPKVKVQIEKILDEKKKLEELKLRQGNQVAAYQRRYHDNLTKTQKLEQELARVKSQKPTGSQSAIPAKKAEQEVDADLKALMETDEQLARIIMRQREEQAERIAALESRLEQVHGEVTPVRQRQQEVEALQEVEKLRTYVSNAEEIVNHPAWAEFVDLAPPGVQALANSDRAEDVYSAMQLYASWVQSSYGQPEQQHQSPAPQGKTVDPDKAKQAQQVQQARERKLQSQPVGSSSAPPITQKKPSLEQIMANPELYQKEFDKQFEAELKKMGVK